MQGDKIKLSKIVQTCDACPSQWDAVADDGRPVYIRYRWGNLTTGVGKQGETKDAAVWKCIQAPDVDTYDVGDGNGVIEIDEVMPFIEALT